MWVTGFDVNIMKSVGFLIGTVKQTILLFIALTESGINVAFIHLLKDKIIALQVKVFP